MNLDIGKLHHGKRNEAIFWLTVTKIKTKMSYRSDVQTYCTKSPSKPVGL